MDKGYYGVWYYVGMLVFNVAIHNKNGQGLLLLIHCMECLKRLQSQSTIKMDKGYYKTFNAGL